jgi:hypothetical protein
MIIANTPAAIGAGKSTVQVRATGGKWQEIPQASKTAIAIRIIATIEKIIQ